MDSDGHLNGKTDTVFLVPSAQRMLPLIFHSFLSLKTIFTIFNIFIVKPGTESKTCTSDWCAQQGMFETNQPIQWPVRAASGPLEKCKNLRRVTEWRWPLRFDMTPVSTSRWSSKHISILHGQLALNDTLLPSCCRCHTRLRAHTHHLGEGRIIIRTIHFRVSCSVQSQQVSPASALERWLGTGWLEGGAVEGLLKCSQGYTGILEDASHQNVHEVTWGDQHFTSHHSKYSMTYQ